MRRREGASGGAGGMADSSGAEACGSGVVGGSRRGSHADHSSAVGSGWCASSCLSRWFTGRPPSGRASDDAGLAVGGEPLAGPLPLDHAALDVGDVVALLHEPLRRPGRSARRIRQTTATVSSVSGSSSMRAGSSPSGMWMALGAWPAAHSSASRTSTRTASSGSSDTVVVGIVLMLHPDTATTATHVGSTSLATREDPVDPVLTSPTATSATPPPSSRSSGSATRSGRCSRCTSPTTPGTARGAGRCSPRPTSPR